MKLLIKSNILYYFCNSENLFMNYFWLQEAIDLLGKIGKGCNPNRIKNIFDIWMKKIGMMKDQPVEVRVLL